MKLLDPRTIQSNLNNQRKTDIDQGLTLARKVDVLRETLSVEEAKLTTFREVTIKEVQRQIDEKIRERDILAQEIKEAEKQRTELLKPLDEAWALVIEDRKKLEDEKTETYVLNQQLEKSLIEVNKSLSEIEIEEKRQEEAKLQIKKQAEQSSDILIEAQDRFTKALDEEKRVEILVRNKTRKLDEREAVLQATVNDIARKEKDLKAEYKFISEEKIRIADQRATLERAMARIKK